MDHIWQEMAEKMIARNSSARVFAADYRAEDLAAAMADAWGNDREATIWTTEDVLEYAEELDVSLDEDEARAILKELASNLGSYNGFDILGDLISAYQEDTGDDYDDYDD